jgi:hypothetical protein
VVLVGSGSVSYDCGCVTCGDDAGGVSETDAGGGGGGGGSISSA